MPIDNVTKDDFRVRYMEEAVYQKLKEDADFANIRDSIITNGSGIEDNSVFYALSDDDQVLYTTLKRTYNLTTNPAEWTEVLDNLSNSLSTPRLRGLGSAVRTYDGTSIPLDSEFYVEDVDGNGWNTGTLSIVISGDDLDTNEDQIEFSNPGAQIATGDASSGGTVIGTTADTEDDESIEITLNANATTELIQTFLRNLSYGTLSNTARASEELTITVTVEDADANSASYVIVVNHTGA